MLSRWGSGADPVDVLECGLCAAGDRIRRSCLHDLGTSLTVGQGAKRLESLEHIASPEPAIGGYHRRVALQA